MFYYNINFTSCPLPKSIIFKLHNVLLQYKKVYNKFDIYLNYKTYYYYKKI